MQKRTQVGIGVGVGFLAGAAVGGVAIYLGHSLAVVAGATAITAVILVLAWITSAFGVGVQFFLLHWRCSNFSKTPGIGVFRRISVFYLVTSLILPKTWDGKGLAVKTAGGISLILLFTVLDPSKLSIHSVDKMRQQEEILESWQGSYYRSQTDQTDPPMPWFVGPRIARLVEEMQSVVAAVCCCVDTSEIE